MLAMQCTALHCMPLHVPWSPSWDSQQPALSMKLMHAQQASWDLL